MATTLRADALTTLAAVKEELGIATADTSQDGRLTRLINAATSQINQYCNRVLGRASITNERQALAGGPRVFFARPPINSITSIVVEDSSVVFDSSGYIRENDKAGIVYIKQTLPSFSLRRPGIAQDRQPGTEAPILLLTYDGGYTTPAQVDTGGTYAGQPQTMPDDLEIACLNLVSYLNNHRGAGGAIQSETLGDAQVDYAKFSKETETEIGLPPHVRGQVNPYRITRFV